MSSSRSEKIRSNKCRSDQRLNLIRIPAQNTPGCSSRAESAVNFFSPPFTDQAHYAMLPRVCTHPVGYNSARRKRRPEASRAFEKRAEGLSSNRFDNRGGESASQWRNSPRAEESKAFLPLSFFFPPRGLDERRRGAESPGRPDGVDFAPPRRSYWSSRKRSLPEAEFRAKNPCQSPWRSYQSRLLIVLLPTAGSLPFHPRAISRASRLLFREREQWGLITAGREGSIGYAQLAVRAASSTPDASIASILIWPDVQRRWNFSARDESRLRWSCRCLCLSETTALHKAIEIGAATDLPGLREFIYRFAADSPAVRYHRPRSRFSRRDAAILHAKLV